MLLLLLRLYQFYDFENKTVKDFRIKLHLIQLNIFDKSQAMVLTPRSYFFWLTQIHRMDFWNLRLNHLLASHTQTLLCILET
jgi:hypothetical protein